MSDRAHPRREMRRIQAEAEAELVYLDASAAVKLVLPEPESAALAGFLADRPGRMSSALSRVEVVRAVRDHGPAAIRRARLVLQ